MVSRTLTTSRRRIYYPRNALAAADSANPTKLASGAANQGANAGNGAIGSHIFGVGVGMTDGGLTNMYRVLDSGVAPNHVNLAYPRPSIELRAGRLHSDAPISRLCKLP